VIANALEFCSRSIPYSGRVCTQVKTRIGNLYCRLFHKSISLPVLGKYRCWKCLREFNMTW